MHNVTFQGYEMLSFYYSPNRSYSLLRYPTNLNIVSRVTICTGKRFQNGFISYIGCKNESDADDITIVLQEWGGFFRTNENFARPSDRLFYRDRTHYPLELKVRGLILPDVIEIAEHWSN